MSLNYFEPNLFVPNSTVPLTHCINVLGLIFSRNRIVKNLTVFRLYFITKDHIVTKNFETKLYTFIKKIYPVFAFCRRTVNIKAFFMVRFARALIKWSDYDMVKSLPKIENVTENKNCTVWYGCTPVLS